MVTFLHIFSVMVDETKEKKMMREEFCAYIVSAKSRRPPHVRLAFFYFLYKVISI